MKFWTQAFATAAAMACAQMGFAQSQFVMYGAIDLSLDTVKKSQGDVQGTVFGLSGMTPVPNRIASPAERTTRVSTGLTTPSYLGFKGSEDMGGGWRASFQLESPLVPDSGGLGADGRLFGRMAWLGLTTPAGEVRIGRQAAPMLAAYFLNSLEGLGSTDLLAAGVTGNTLQMYQDNMVSYALQAGPWVGQLSYAPNAGVASRISAARAQSVGGLPVATEATGQIVGGASAGAETTDGRGRTLGGFAAYLGEDWRLVGGFHRNVFNAPAGLVTPQGMFVPLFQLTSFQSWMVGGKYKVTSTGTELAFNVHHGIFKESAGANPETQTLAFAVRQSVGSVDLIGQLVQAKFTNFTRGKDTAFMLGLERHLSKRTTLYARVGQLRDQRGQSVVAPQTPLPLAGGPAVLLVPLGALEIPYFSGAGANMSATTRLFGVGVRHSF